MSDTTRIDKWLWHARFCRTRVIAQAKAAAGIIRVNGQRVEKASKVLRIGDVVTLPALGGILAVRVIGLSAKRRSAAEARTLYEVLPERRDAQPVASQDTCGEEARSQAWPAYDLIETRWGFK